MTNNQKPRAFASREVEVVKIDPTNVVFFNLQDTPGVYFSETDDAIWMELDSLGGEIEIPGWRKRLRLMMRVLVRRGRARRYRRISTLQRVPFRFVAKRGKNGRF